MPLEGLIRELDTDDPKVIGVRTLQLLSAHDVAPTPPNYEVIYDYLLGEKAGLRHDIDRYLAHGRRLDEATLRLWYERHVAPDQLGLVRGMGADLEKIAEDLIGMIGEAGDIAGRFGETLSAGIEVLNECGPDQRVKAVIEQMLGAARAAHLESQRLQRLLQSSLATTTSLMQELEQRRREALIDPLTGLFNRRAMDAHMATLVAADDAPPVSVLVIDLDNFKAINDEHGHTVGDSVIRNVADLIRRSIRGGDLAARFGGEEFVIILADTPARGAMAVAEALRLRIELLRLKRTRDGQLLAPITASIGVTAMRIDDTAESVINRADDALYAAKNSGRNRVVMAAATQAEAGEEQPATADPRGLG